MKQRAAMVALATVAVSALLAGCGIEQQFPSAQWVTIPDNQQVRCVGTTAGGLSCDWANVRRVP